MPSGRNASFCKRNINEFAKFHNYCCISIYCCDRSVAKVGVEGSNPFVRSNDFHTLGIEPLLPKAAVQTKIISKQSQIRAKPYRASSRLARRHNAFGIVRPNPLQLPREHLHLVPLARVQPPLKTARTIPHHAA